MVADLLPKFLPELSRLGPNAGLKLFCVQNWESFCSQSLHPKHNLEESGGETPECLTEA